MLAASQERVFFAKLIVIHCNDFDSCDMGIFREATELSVLMKVYIIFCYERGHINVTVVLQSCTDSLHVLSGSSCETFPTSSDGTYDVSNIKVEEDIDIKGVEEEDMEAEKGIGNEEDECIDIKDEEGIYSEEEEEEDIDTKEDEDINIKEEVSCGGTV
jgi:hypothetical protein